MANEAVAEAFNCLVGDPYQDAWGVWRCTSGIAGAGDNNPKWWANNNVRPLTETVYINQGMTKEELDKYLQSVLNNTSGSSTNSSSPLVQQIQSFIANNKLIVGVGLVALIYAMFFSGGLGASDRTITSVTRYGRKS